MIEAIGGYDSNRFWGITLLSLFIGTILTMFNNIIIRVLGEALFIFGGTLLVLYINNLILTTEGLPNIASTFPFLSSVLVILGAVRLISMHPIFMKHKRDAEENK
jgi:hypothetical protein